MFEHSACTLVYGVPHVCLVPKEVRRECVRVGVTGACEPPSWCWEQNAGPQQEQQVFLTAGPSLLIMGAGDTNLGLHGYTQRLPLDSKLT